MAGLPVHPGASQLGALARELATAAGHLIVHDRPAGLGVAATKSSEVDIVTEMDRRSEDLLRARLEQARPRDGVLGEEGDDRPGESDITWVLDPIDGTVNYLYEIPQYAVSVAACTGDARVPGQWAPVAGAVYNPISEELFYAHQGGGAWLQSPTGTQRLQVSSQTRLALSLVGTGFGYDAAVRAAQGAVLTRVLPVVRDIRRSGSAALDLCAVAAGRLDAYYESGLNPWDMAAGALVLTEAGGELRGRAGAPAGPDLTCAGPAVLVDALGEVIAR